MITGALKSKINAIWQDFYNENMAQTSDIVNQLTNPFFLYQMLKLNKEYIISDINMSIKGILSKGNLENKEFIIPPIELQNEFAEFVQQIDKLKFDSQFSLYQWLISPY